MHPDLLVQYYTGGLSTGMHAITVAHADPGGTAFWFDLDKVVVSTWDVSDVAMPSNATSAGITTASSSPTSASSAAATITTPAALDQR